MFASEHFLWAVVVLFLFLFLSSKMASAHPRPECWEDFYVRLVNSFINLLLLLFLNFNSKALLIFFIEKVPYK